MCSSSVKVIKMHNVELLDIKQEIIDYGFIITEQIDNQFTYEKPLCKNRDIATCQIVLNWQLGWPVIFIYSISKGSVNDFKSVIVDGYDLKLKGDFTILMSRLTINLKSIQK